jgi:hypothetical protein
MNKWIVIVGVLILIGLGLFFISGMTGNVITGMVSGGEKAVNVEDEYFRISEFGAALPSVPSDEGKVNREVKDGEDNGGSG